MLSIPTFHLARIRNDSVYDRLIDGLFVGGSATLPPVISPQPSRLSKHTRYCLFASAGVSRSGVQPQSAKLAAGGAKWEENFTPPKYRLAFCFS